MTATPQAVAGLAGALSTVEVEGVFYCPSRMSEPWGGTLPPMPGTVWFHAVISGNCRLIVNENELQLGTGDVALVPHGLGHTILGEADAATPSVLELPHEDIDENFAILHHGGGGRPTDLVCGGVHIAHPLLRRLIDALPDAIVLEAARSGRATWQMIELLGTEFEQRRIANEAIITRLCDIIVLCAIRDWAETNSRDSDQWLRALSHPVIGPAMTAIHNDPGADWTVERLAAVAAMSRSGFVARFSEVVGTSPGAYVTEIRMELAAHQLATSDHTVADIAAMFGYRSEAAFGRAFKRTLGHSPGQFRQQERTRERLAY